MNDCDTKIGKKIIIICCDKCFDRYKLRDNKAVRSSQKLSVCSLSSTLDPASVQTSTWNVANLPLLRCVCEPVPVLYVSSLYLVLDSTYKGCHTVFLFLISLSMTISRVTHVATDSIISLFYD